MWLLVAYHQQPNKLLCKRVKLIEETTMIVPKILQPALKDLVHALVCEHFSEIEADGRAGRLSAAELRQAIREYGRTLVELPDEAFAISRAYAIRNIDQTWRVDLALWTLEENRSDLTLSVTARVVESGVQVEIDDLHVL
jgi:hypothetical protein